MSSMSLPEPKHFHLRRSKSEEFGVVQLPNLERKVGAGAMRLKASESIICGGRDFPANASSGVEPFSSKEFEAMGWGEDVLILPEDALGGDVPSLKDRVRPSSIKWSIDALFPAHAMAEADEPSAAAGEWGRSHSAPGFDMPEFEKIKLETRSDALSIRQASRQVSRQAVRKSRSADDLANTKKGKAQSHPRATYNFLMGLINHSEVQRAAKRKETR